jgi:hypothetical protein
MAEPTVLRHGFERVADGVAVVQDSPQVAFTLVARDDIVRAQAPP